MSIEQLCGKELSNFSSHFNSAYEDAAATSRGEFLRAYPLSRLKDLTIDDYVIGLGTPSFCARVEAKTKAWANIQGATSQKFGIYFGKTKSDPKKKYRFTKKFGTTKAKAFEKIKFSLLKLVADGKRRAFYSIDQNPLSQMFKAKILSLYFPETYLNICSSEHLEVIASELGLPADLPSSQYQRLLRDVKSENPITKDWSNPKFMSFLYAKFIRRNLGPTVTTGIGKPSKRVRRKVDLEELQLKWNEIGKASEEFAVAWEKDRLTGLGYADLVSKISDRRDMPSYGYDFLSFSAPEKERYIEVKSLGFDKKEQCFRFFLSENEQAVSKSVDCGSEYYFYLVRYGKDGEPEELFARRAEELYRCTAVQPCAYVVRLEIL